MKAIVSSLLVGALHLHLDSNGGVAAESIDDFDAGDIFARCGIFIASIADGFEAAIFAGAVVLPVVGEGFTGLPVEVDRPKVDEVKAAFDGAFSDGFKFFGGDFGEGRQKLGEFEIDGAKTLTPLSQSGRGEPDLVPLLLEEKGLGDESFSDTLPLLLTLPLLKMAAGLCGFSP